MRIQSLFAVLMIASLVGCQRVDITGPGGHTPPPPPPPPSTSAATISVSPDSVSILTPKTYQLAGVATGKDGKQTTITWSSLSTSTATVDAKSGLVTAVNPGLARIVATNDADATKKDTVKVLVIQQVQSITISPTSYTGAIGGVMDFTVTVVPSNYTFTCKSSAGSVVTFNLVTVNGVKKCRANFIALSPLNGVSPVQVFAVTDQAHTFPNGTEAQLQAGVQIRVTATGQ